MASVTTRTPQLAVLSGSAGPSPGFARHGLDGVASGVIGRANLDGSGRETLVSGLGYNGPQYSSELTIPARTCASVDPLFKDWSQAATPSGSAWRCKKRC
jgi:hypothetical protein